HDRFGGQAVAHPVGLRGGTVAGVEAGGDGVGVVAQPAAQFGGAELGRGAVTGGGAAHRQVAVSGGGEPVQQQRGRGGELQGVHGAGRLVQRAQVPLQDLQAARVVAGQGAEEQVAAEIGQVVPLLAAV